MHAYLYKGYPLYEYACILVQRYALPMFLSWFLCAIALGSFEYCACFSSDFVANMFVQHTPSKVHQIMKTKGLSTSLYRE